MVGVRAKSRKVKEGLGQKKITESFPIRRRNARLGKSSKLDQVSKEVPEDEYVLASPERRKVPFKVVEHQTDILETEIATGKGSITKEESEMDLSVKIESQQVDKTEVGIIEELVVVSGPTEEIEVEEIEEEIGEIEEIEEEEQEEPPPFSEDDLDPKALSLDHQEEIRVPAYQRLSHLLKEDLPLPPAFELLEKILHVMDNVIVLAEGRNQPAIFHRTARAAESLLGRRIDLAHLNELQSFGLWYELKKTSLVWEGKRTASFLMAFPEPSTSSYLYQRRERLHSLLLEKTKERHSSFLKSIGAKLPDGAQLVRWHPKFDLAFVSTSEEIVVAEIKEAKPIDAGRILEVKQIKGSLLDRIRAKEAASQMQSMSVDLEAQKVKREREDLFALAEHLAILFGTANGKKSLLLGDILPRLQNATSKRNTELIESLNKLEGRLPEWFERLDSGGVAVLRLKKGHGLGEIRQQIFDL